MVNLRTFLRVVGGGARLWMAAIGALRFVERILLAGAALTFSKDHIKDAAAITVLLGLLAALRAAARAPLLAIVRRRLIAAVADLALRRHESAGEGERAQTEVTIFEALWAAEELATERLPGIVADASAATLIGGLVAWTLPAHMIATGVIVLLVAALAAEGARRVSGAQAQRSWEAFLPVASSVEACIRGGLELVGNGRDRDQRDQVRAATERWIRTAWRADWLSGLSGRLPILLGFVGVMVALVYARSARGIAPEAALAEAVVVASCLPPFASLLTNLVEVARSSPKLEPLKELVAEEASATSPGRATSAPPGHNGRFSPEPIRWESIEYAYPLAGGERGPRVLAGCSGEWRPGRILAIAGPNGAGKSTLFRLLLGFDRPSRGALVVGETPLHTIEVRAFRANFAYLSQRPFMPSEAKVRDAIRFLAPEALDAEMTRALSKVGLWDRLTRESKQAPLDVPISALSAGEKQRVALARVVAQDAPFVLLDEPDANLDAAGVELLGGLLRELAAEGRMVAFIAHDERLLAAADHVLHFFLAQDEVSTRPPSAEEVPPSAEEEAQRWLSNGSRFM